jgi:3-hydroxyisobutyrate dehydrogenase-like beta-hydroxyacid dehydrogenase
MTDDAMTGNAMTGSAADPAPARPRIAVLGTGTMGASPDFSLRLATKDAGLALEAAAGLDLAGLAAIRDRWQALIGQGLGDLDTSAARHGFGRQPAAAG